MSQAKPVSTLLPANHQLTTPAIPAPSSELRPYPELVGSLMYAMMCTRPDLAYPLSVLSCFVALVAILVCTGQLPSASCVISAPPLILLSPLLCSSRSLGLHWCSTRSSYVCLSTSEADLYAGILAAREAHWLSFLLDELGHSQPCVTLACDSASMIHLTENPVYHARSKYIKVRYFFVRELVLSGFLCLCKVATNANLADIFTKSLLHGPRRFYVRVLGLTHLTTSGGVPIRYVLCCVPELHLAWGCVGVC
ncbi:unnamed protein product [Closterium sp. NIES-53]